MTASPDAAGTEQPSPRIAIIIVNYQSGDLTIDCLRSIDEELTDVAGIEVYVADNASPDGSGGAIEAAILNNGWSGWAQVLHLPRNGGFAYGNNAALKKLVVADGTDFIWLLNPDTIIRHGAMEALLSFMQANPRVGIAGSRLEDPDGTLQACAFRFHTIASEFEASVALGPITRLFEKWRVAPELPDHPIAIDWISGASMMIRAQVLHDIGLMDDSYFLYFEETDWCLRAHKAGWETWYVPASRVIHLVGHTTGVTRRDEAPRRRPAYWFESRRHYFTKHHGILYASAADIALAVGVMINRLRAISGQAQSWPPRFLFDLMLHGPLSVLRIRRNQ